MPEPLILDNKPGISQQASSIIKRNIILLYNILYSMLHVTAVISAGVLQTAPTGPMPTNLTYLPSVVLTSYWLSSKKSKFKIYLML